MLYYISRAVFFQPTGAQGRREGEVGGIEGAEEAAIEFDLGVEAATGVETGVSSAGASKADEEDTKLSFFFRNSSLRLAFLLIVEGLGFFLSKSNSFESKEKEKHEAKVRENLKVLALQCLAEFQALGCQVTLTHCSHFLYF